MGEDVTQDRQTVRISNKHSTTKRGFPVYRTNPSVPERSGIPTRKRRFQVPGGKAAVIVDSGSGEIRGLGGMGFWWEEEVDTSRFVKLFLEGIKQAADLSKTGRQAFELVYYAMRANRKRPVYPPWQLRRVRSSSGHPQISAWRARQTTVAA